MTPERRQLLEQSWPKIQRDADRLAALFYARLFELAPERQAKSEPLSDWATPWWRAREHDTLRNVRASPMTEVDHWDIGFSIQMLEDEAGVRVFWKYGSRESNE